jgi:hypothetical protein
VPLQDPFRSGPTSVVAISSEIPAVASIVPADKPAAAPAPAGTPRAAFLGRPARPSLEDTSWESPFEAGLWAANGWQFEDERMRSLRTGGAALFRRAYLRLMLDCRVAPLSDPSGTLRLRVVTPETGAAVSVLIEQSRLAVVDETQVPPLLVKEATIEPAATRASPGGLRLAATGNRLVIGWNGRVALACEQPAAQSGHPAQIEFVAGDAPFEITALRIEGE